jgi:hypothetical protein
MAEKFERTAGQAVAFTVVGLTVFAFVVSLWLGLS